MQQKRYVITNLRGDFLTHHVEGWEISNNRELAIVFTLINAQTFYKSILSKYEQTIFKIVEIDEIDQKEIEMQLMISEERVKRVNSMREECNKKISEQDGKINDILHYIEFNRLDKEEAYKICASLHDIRNERRKNKDLHSKLELLCRVDSSNNVLKTIKTAKKSLKGMEQRKYAPRQLPELFAATNYKEESHV